MRDLLVFLVVLLTLPISFRRPFVGMLVFSWLAYMRPQDLCWSFARDMRLSFYVAIAMLVGWWANERGRRRFARWDIRSKMLLTLAALVAISYSMASYQSEYYNRYFIEFLKIIIVALFTSGQVDSRARFRGLTWMIAICLAFYGVKGGLFGLLTGGASILRGPGGMLEDNNDFALAMAMNVPLLWYLGYNDRAIPFVRILTRIGIVLTVITISLTHSRGAFLALVGTALWISWRSGHLFRAGFSLMMSAAAFLIFAPASVLIRIQSIGDPNESSARARLVAWRTALRMIADNPVFGVGLRNFQPRYVDYAKERLEDGTIQTYVAHNSYLQIWAESGSLAFGVYLLLLISTFFTCRRIWRIGMQFPGMSWASDYARMLEATMVAFMIGAMFLNRGHFDLVYHWIALVTSLSVIGYAAASAPALSVGKNHSSAAEITVRRRLASAFGSITGNKQQPIWRRVH
jgi:probable O-glycosylation ligase (exosortase A-associated)